MSEYLGVGHEKTTPYYLAILVGFETGKRKHEAKDQKFLLSEPLRKKQQENGGDVRQTISVIIIALYSAVIPLVGFGQTFQQPAEEWSVNIASSPLEIGLSPNQRFLNLLNRSSGNITRYRLGCVVQNGESMKVLRRFSPVNSQLAPGKVLINSVTIYSESVQRCSLVRAKVAVIEVRFKDGSVWKLP